MFVNVAAMLFTVFITIFFFDNAALIIWHMYLLYTLVLYKILIMFLSVI
jgi:hypothetical protein